MKIVKEIKIKDVFCWKLKILEFLDGTINLGSTQNRKNLLESAGGSSQAPNSNFYIEMDRK